MDREQTLAKLRSLGAHQRLIDAHNLCFNITQQYPQDSEIWMWRSAIHYMISQINALSKMLQQPAHPSRKKANALSVLRYADGFLLYVFPRA